MNHNMDPQMELLPLARHNPSVQLGKGMLSTATNEVVTIVVLIR